MKTLLTIMLCTVLSMSASAQGKKGHRQHMKNNLSIEQKAELATKKMVLELDLNESQSSKVQTLLTSNFTKMEAKRKEMKTRKEEGKRPSAEERYAMQNERLDDQIAMKRDMKNILTSDQFETWEKMKKRRGKNRGESRKRGDRKQSKRDRN